MSEAAGNDELADFERFFAEAPLHKALGLTLEERRTDYARIALRTSPVTLGGVGGGVHGGVLAAMIDVAMLAALFTVRSTGLEPAGTADLNITYLRPALGSRVTAEATVMKRGRLLAVTEVEIRDEEGQVCAKGRTLYAFRDRGGG